MFDLISFLWSLVVVELLHKFFEPLEVARRRILLPIYAGWEVLPVIGQACRHNKGLNCSNEMKLSCSTNYPGA